jgi:hypothetical protein
MPGFNKAGTFDMGSSFTEFRGKGFWARDPGLELWLYLLAVEAAKVANPPQWLRKAQADWHLQATAGFVGCISASLDEHVCFPDRIELVIGLAERALAWLHSQGPNLPADLLNSFNLGGPGALFQWDAPTAVFIPVGNAFISLLRLEWTGDAASSPVL